MKYKLLLPFLLATLLLTPFSIAAQTYYEKSASHALIHQNKQDAALLGWLTVLNKNEIGAGHVILKRRALNPRVRHFAEFMIMQHTELLKNTLQVSREIHTKPIKMKDALKLHKEGEKLLIELRPLDNQAMQKTYIDAMVKGHKEALASLKSYLRKEKDPALKELLLVTKRHVAMHLEKAEMIQKQLG